MENEPPASSKSQPHTASPSQGMEQLKRQIWQNELRYIQSYREAKHGNILATWHESFLGWPGPARLPQRRANGEQFLKQVYPSPGKWDFSIEPLAVEITGNIAVTQYLLRSWPVAAPNSEQIRYSRITHTWLNENGQWKILGGMSAHLDNL